MNHSQGEWVRADDTQVGMRACGACSRRSIVGSYHQLSTKHLPAYLDEMSFRFNNRENPFQFRDTIKRLLDAETLRYAELTAESAI